MSFVSLMIGDTGAFLRIADPKTVAGQARWEQATNEALALERQPSRLTATRLLARVADSSDLGDPTQPGWLPSLKPAAEVAVMEQLTTFSRNWRRATASAITNYQAETGAVSAVKAAQDRAAGLRLAAEQAGPQRGELLAKAAEAEQEAERLVKAAMAQTRPARRSSTWTASGELADPPEFLTKAGRAR